MTMGWVDSGNRPENRLVSYSLAATDLVSV
jgi:hypothetical protein